MSENKIQHGEVLAVARDKRGDWVDGKCILCGRMLGSRAQWVHFVDGGSIVHAENSTDTYDAAGEMGYWPVGSECAKTFAAGVLAKGLVA